MSRGRHRKQPTTWFTWKMWLASIIGLGVVLVACAAGGATPAQGQETLKPTDWKPMAVPGLEYACDPVLGVMVRHTWKQWQQSNPSDGYDNWVISVTPYSQMTAGQRQQMCEINR